MKQERAERDMAYYIDSRRTVWAIHGTETGELRSFSTHLSPDDIHWTALLNGRCLHTGIHEFLIQLEAENLAR